MRRTITLVVFCYHERVCIHAYCVDIYGGVRGLDKKGENDSLSSLVHFAVSLEGEGAAFAAGSLI